MNLNNGQTLQRLVTNDENTLKDSQASTITFHSINYTLHTQKCCNACSLPCIKKKHKQILYDINGIFKPGMNAILGPTGSGKSSLLDILADRKARYGLDGQVLMNGQIQTKDFKYRVGYVVQEDILSGTLTVRENLRFSANVRLSKNISRETKTTIVERVIEQLGLETCADTRVGTEFLRGISGGEKKRTNIGMELVLSPSVLFLDEPTTGLDSSTARNVMEYLHQLSRQGRTIIFSIHQPRYHIFKLFDTLFIVAAGYCVYHGPTNAVLPYFSSMGYVCEEHDNPADFLLDITQGDSSRENNNQHDLNNVHEQNALHLHDLYIKSNIYASIQQELTNENNRKITTTAIANYEKLASKSRLLEIFYVAQRTLRNVYRNPILVTMQTIVTIIFATLVGLIYLQVDRTEDTGVKNRMGAIFFIVTNQVMGNLSAIELFLKERVLFIHENASGYYHVSTYFIAKLLCDLIPLRIIPSILFSAIVYFMIGFQKTVEKFFIFYFAIFLTAICGAAVCFFISASVKVFGIANLLAAMCFVLMMVFGGFLVEVSSVIKYLSWIKWVSLFRYSMNIITINEFNGLQLCLNNNTNICPIDGIDIIHNIAHIEYETEWDLWKNFVALGSMTTILFLLTYIQLFRMKKTK
ncbi:unnamed protein product [Rotaria sordida]|uniref:ABC transporter domain-containing protein n=1 Tax=Rotaria sordida TaxID=392033 RepID=A0A814DCF9_9BILA|nr:unnamed protein product [Rotaria sordida]CAF0953901.1 unnamed protein product [Rotaria sordida]CAF3680016.1 unnamed protein product [Rotaria sordida]